MEGDERERGGVELGRGGYPATHTSHLQLASHSSIPDIPLSRKGISPWLSITPAMSR